MPIDLPLKLDFVRPLSPPDTPYRQCNRCQFIAIPTQPDARCPGCGGSPADRIWPEVELLELWHDEVFCWNHEKAEIATVVAAMYFEASTFHLLFWATCWLDRDLNWRNARLDELRDKQERIQVYLNSLTTVEKTSEALVRAFGVNGKQMLEHVLGGEAGPFWANYTLCRNWRNQIAHRGKRIYYETILEAVRRDNQPARDQALRASLKFVPQCWVVFSKLWNEYIHKAMWTPTQAETAK